MDEIAKGSDSTLPIVGAEKAEIDRHRRAVLRKLRRFVAVTPPVVTLLLSARAKPALAAGSGFSSRQFKEPVSLPLSRLA